MITYAQARLRLGICGVGLFVVSSCVVLCAGWDRTLTLSQWLSFYLLASLPLDLAGGQVLPRIYGAERVPLGRWLALYTRALLAHASLWLLTLSLLASAPASWLFGLSCLFSATLLSAQLVLCRWVGIRKGETGWVSSDRRWSGGVTGLPGFASRIDPLRSPAPEAQRRRHNKVLASGARSAGVVVAVLWCGLVTAWLGRLANHNPVTLSCYATLGAFLGLLVLPSLSRPGVYYADQGSDGDELRALEAFQEEDPERPRWIERVFHPIPDLNKRLQRLPQSAPWAPWNVARCALLLGWWQGALLSRAVHCNSGRPELWFWPPND